MKLPSFTTILTVLLLIAIGGYGWLYIDNQSLRSDLAVCRTSHPSPPTVGSSITAAIALPVADTVTDAKGRKHTVFEDTRTQDLVRAEAEAIASPYLLIIDSLKEANKNRPGAAIEGYSAVQLEMVRDSVRFIKRLLDKERRQKLDFEDKYVRLSVQVPAPEDTVEKGSFDLSYNADISSVEYSTVRRFWGIPISNRRYYTDISSSDRRMKIKGAEKFTIARRVPPLGLRLQATSTYNIDRRTFGYGVGTRFDIGDRFNCGVNWIYSPQRGDGDFGIYAKYDLLQWGR